MVDKYILMLFMLLSALTLYSCAYSAEPSAIPINESPSYPDSETNVVLECFDFEYLKEEKPSPIIYEDLYVAENDSPMFMKKYNFWLWPEPCAKTGEVGEIGTLLGFPRSIEEYLMPAFGVYPEFDWWGGTFYIKEHPEGSIYIFDHAGWPGPIRNNVDTSLYMIGPSLDFNPRNIRDAGGDIDRDYRISVIVGRTSVTLLGNPRALENTGTNFGNYNVSISSDNSGFSLRIPYEQKDESELWQWLMDENNAWRIAVRNPEPWNPLSDATTNDLWEKWGIQAFVYGGDTTLVSRRGILSQIPELQNDILYFDLVVQGDFETQYIMFHERADSKLWQLLERYIAPLTISYSWLE